VKTIHFPNCWVCGRAVSLGNSKIDENHLAAHESCYVAKIALEQSQPGTVASRNDPSQARRRVDHAPTQIGAVRLRPRRTLEYPV
jgi:hypothetical protein